MPAYAHSHPDFPADPSTWEPLFTPFGNAAAECQRESCQKCRDLDPAHGHLNKVAFWTAKFASEMFAPDSAEAKSAHNWGYLAGLWHDLGKFAEEFQERLKGVPLPVDHSTLTKSRAAVLLRFVDLFRWQKPLRQCTERINFQNLTFHAGTPFLGCFMGDRQVQLCDHLLVYAAPIPLRPLFQQQMQFFR